jgi:hypothetical protein
MRPRRRGPFAARKNKKIRKKPGKKTLYPPPTTAAATPRAAALFTYSPNHAPSIAEMIKTITIDAASTIPSRLSASEGPGAVNCGSKAALAHKNRHRLRTRSALNAEKRAQGFAGAARKNSFEVGGGRGREGGLLLLLLLLLLPLLSSGGGDGNAAAAAPPPPPLTPLVATPLPPTRRLRWWWW